MEGLTENKNDKDLVRYKTRDVSTVSGTKPVRSLGTTPFKTWIKWH